MQLLQLPDPCLVVVLQCCADDKRSLFSAARAHSRLHQAAVLALSSITVCLKSQQQLDNLLLYLPKHGQQVDNMDRKGLGYGTVPHFHLSPNLQLASLNLTNLRVISLPRDTIQDKLRQHLKHLQISHCQMLDGTSKMAAALALLPGLQHLSFTGSFWDLGRFMFPLTALAGLQELTYLELAHTKLQRPDSEECILQPLQSLTRLVGLRLSLEEVHSVTVHSSMLTGMQQLTRLELIKGTWLQPGTLIASTELQHLCLAIDGVASDEEVAHLLSLLHDLQQLTHLDLEFAVSKKSNISAADFSALTASSKLQHLSLSRCWLPAGVWQHMFPAGRQLPQLRSLKITYVRERPSRDTATAEKVLQMAQRKQLTRLAFDGKCWTHKGPQDQPVWRQVLLCSLEHSDPDVAHQVAAALAE